MHRRRRQAFLREVETVAEEYLEENRAGAGKLESDLPARKAATAPPRGTASLAS